MTDALVQFLSARLAEDGQVAQGHEQASASWHADDFVMEVRDDANAGTVATVYRSGDLTHIVRHDPARVLAEVDAKRRIVDHVAHELEDHGADNPWWYDDKLLPILRLLALPYASHPDFREDWRP